MKRIVHFIVALTMVAIPHTGHTFAATNGLSVNPVNGAVFEVNDGRGARAPAFWCAAANYARRSLKVDWQTELYIVRTMGPSTTSNRGAAVHYSIDPGAVGVTPAASSSMNSYVVGDHMTVQRANTYCR